MSNRIKIILFAVLLMGIVVGADRILKMQGNGDGSFNRDISNNLESGDKVSSNIIEVTFETFSGEVIESDKKVLIDFYATWCEPCKLLSPIVEEIASDREDIKVVKIDVDKEEIIAYKYGIISLPTLVVVENGVEVERLVGLRSRADIENMISVKKFRD